MPQGEVRTLLTEVARKYVADILGYRGFTDCEQGQAERPMIYENAFVAWRGAKSDHETSLYTMKRA